MRKKLLTELTKGTFFTFDSQLKDLFMKTKDGFVRIPNTEYGHSSEWLDDYYRDCTNYVILSTDEVLARIVQIGVTHCKECGQKLP